MLASPPCYTDAGLLVAAYLTVFFFKAAIKYYESTLVNHIHFSLLPIDWLICGSLNHKCSNLFL
jgi:hypothetical protein